MRQKSLSHAIRLASLGVIVTASSYSLAQENQLKISGFATIAASVSDTEYLADNNITDEVSLNPDSVIGIQFDARPTDKTSLTVQLVARGDNSHSRTGKGNFEPDVEWAFIGLHLKEGHVIKVGRMRNPIFMNSANLEVGVTYPWVRPPQEVYARAVATEYDGINYSFLTDINDDWQMEITPYLGTNTNTEAATSKNFSGINLDFISERLTIHLGATHIKLDLLSAQAGVIAGAKGIDAGWAAAFGTAAVPYNAQFSFGPATPGNSNAQLEAAASNVYSDQTMDLFNLGYSYNGDLFFATSEVSYVESTNKVSIVNDVISGYATIGLNLGNLHPHLTYANAQTINNQERREVAEDQFSQFDQQVAFSPAPGAPTTTFNPVSTVFTDETKGNQRQSLTLGLRWNYDSRSALKFDVQYLSEFGDTNGFMGNRGTDGPVDNDDEEVLIYRLALTTTF